MEICKEIINETLVEICKEALKEVRVCRKVNFHHMSRGSAGLMFAVEKLHQVQTPAVLLSWLRVALSTWISIRC